MNDVDADFVIVGAGSAGCALAERLSRNGKHSVLVVEAGGSDRKFWIQVPLGYGRLFYDPKVNWMYYTEPDPGLGGRRDYWPRGKVIGGSSSVNAMVYIRGHPADYDDWAARGNVGWSWANVAGHFEEIEHFNTTRSTRGDATVGRNVRDVSNYVHPMARRLVDAATELQLPFNHDFNAESQEGVGYYRLTCTQNGERNSSARIFLHPARKRPNLRIMENTHVETLEFDGKRVIGLRAIGKNGALVTVRANREVVLAAGAINSPSLLQRSGIGAADHLRRLGINVLHVNANVGAHLQDHLGIDYVYRSRSPTLNNSLSTWHGRVLAGLNYLLFRRGPLALSVNQSGGFFRTDPGRERPNMQLYYQGLTTLTAQSGSRPLLAPDPFAAFKLGISACHPQSRGHIRITSPSSDVPPAIHPNSFSAPEDLEEMLAGVKFLRRLAEQRAFREVVDAEILPGLDCQSDTELVADIRARAGTVYHPSGTCRMGTSADDSVVDPRLRVHGLSGLRVADASVFPAIPSGNINAPSMMVGIKAGDMILEDASVGAQ